MWESVSKAWIQRDTPSCLGTCMRSVAFLRFQKDLLLPDILRTFQRFFLEEEHVISDAVVFILKRPRGYASWPVTWGHWHLRSLSILASASVCQTRSSWTRAGGCQTRGYKADINTGQNACKAIATFSNFKHVWQSAISWIKNGSLHVN